MVAKWSSQTTVATQQTRPRYIPEGDTLQLYRRFHHHHVYNQLTALLYIL
jgi:hypothetical protein